MNTDPELIAIGHSIVSIIKWIGIAFWLVYAFDVLLGTAIDSNLLDLKKRQEARDDLEFQEYMAENFGRLFGSNKSETRENLDALAGSVEITEADHHKYQDPHARRSHGDKSGFEL